MFVKQNHEVDTGTGCQSKKQKKLKLQTLTILLYIRKNVVTAVFFLFLNHHFWF